jgi:hypothetical protein
MQRSLQNGELALEYNAKFREYGIQILDGGSSVMQIQLCPWCGASLPSSLRETWFNRLNELGIDPYEEQVPPEYKTAKWWEGDFELT